MQCIYCQNKFDFYVVEDFNICIDCKNKMDKIKEENKKATQSFLNRIEQEILQQ